MPEHAKLDIDAKVVHLEPESQKIVRAKLARLPEPVLAVHEKGKHLVLALLKTFFEKVDDSLFELADKAQSNQEQNLYFDSMREVRVQRRAIEKHFADAIDIAFADLVSPDTPKESSNVVPETLSLIENDQLDEIIAVDTTVGRALQVFGEAVQMLSLRLDTLVPVKVYQQNNPLGPDVICNAFVGETKRLDIGIKAKLVLFKLFDKSVVSRLGDVYGAVNGLLIEHKVLPSLSQSSTSSGSSPTGAVAPGATTQPGVVVSSPEDVSGVNSEVLSTLKSMLGERVVANTSVSSQTQAAANELIGLLSRVQHLPAVMNNKVALNVRALIEQLQKQTGATTVIGQVDDQVMNLVNMLFDFILDDKSLAAPMKALISRMQIPIIKVAVADKSFFTQSGHVARRLLNDMATSAMGWAGDQATCQNDPLYKKIEFIVRKLIDEFETDLGIFDELQADFSAFVEKEKKRAAVLERRTVDAEDGKAKAEVARTTVELEIELRTVDQTLPEVVNDLIRDAWNNVMFVTALKYGYESEEWERNLGVLEDLVWSVQLPKDASHRQKLIKLVPDLLKRLRAGLDTISYNPFEMSDLFKSLEKVHIACIRGKPAKKPKVEPNTEARGPQAAKGPEVESKSSVQTGEPEKKAATQRGRPVPRPMEEEELPAPSLRDLAMGVELSEIQEVDPKTAAAKRAEETMPTTLPADDPFMRQVSAFSQGAWFDMQNSQGENIRSRLAAVIKPVGRYIFVNRNGMKVAEHSQVELAHMLKEGVLRSLDDSALFDRALETVVTGLRKN